MATGAAITPRTVTTIRIPLDRSRYTILVFRGPALRACFGRALRPFLGFGGIALLAGGNSDFGSNFTASTFGDACNYVGRHTLAFQDLSVETGSAYALVFSSLLIQHDYPR
jgi:hypothetical protein